MIDKSGFHFTYDGENSKSHKLVVTGVDDYALPQKKVITYDIDGRDGSLLYDTKAFENRLVKIQVKLMCEIQAALDNAKSDHFNYTTFRRAILDSHGYIKAMFEEVDSDAKFTNS